MQRSPASFCDGSSKDSEPGLIMRIHQVRGTKQSPSPVSFKSIKVLSTREKWEVFKLKDTEETWPLNVICGSSLGPFAIKDVIGTTGDTWVRSGDSMVVVHQGWWDSDGYECPRVRKCTWKDSGVMEHYMGQFGKIFFALFFPVLLQYNWHINIVSA